MVEESEGIFDDGFGAQGHVAAQAQLGPPDEFQDEQIIQKGPGPLDDDCSSRHCRANAAIFHRHRRRISA